MIGEGEITLKELINSIDRDESNFNHIDGIAYKDNDRVIRNAPRQIVKELDSFPMPAWDLIDIPSYKKIWIEKSWILLTQHCNNTRLPFQM